jgi:hypothetical protein
VYDPGSDVYGTRGGTGTAGPTIASGSASGWVKEGTSIRAFAAQTSRGSRLKATVPTILLVCLFLFDTPSILQEMSVVSVAASRSTPVLTLAANSGCVRLHFVRSTGNSPLVPAIRGNSVVGTYRYCKMASTSLGGTLGVLRQILFTFAGFCTLSNLIAIALCFSTSCTNGQDFYEGSGHVPAAKKASFG